MTPPITKPRAAKALNVTPHHQLVWAASDRKAVKIGLRRAMGWTSILHNHQANIEI
jgi:hypothetical protein